MGIRLEESANWSTLYAIYSAAFGQLAEADLVQHMHEDGDLILSVIAYADEPAGHIAYSRLILHETPSFQKQGIGAALVQNSLKRLTDKSYDLVLVLGEPHYYSRFGFTPRLAERLKTPYDGPYLQAFALSDKGKGAHGSVSYAQAFVELE
jgi:putative acetyltransferase